MSDTQMALLVSGVVVGLSLTTGAAAGWAANEARAAQHCKARYTHVLKARRDAEIRAALLQNNLDRLAQMEATR